jgi:rSAM/selenodomain-associated transferase 1
LDLLQPTNNPKRALIVFVKAPIPGDVKTRLIPYLTSNEAADLYKCFVTDVLKNASCISSLAKLSVAYQAHPKASDLSWLGKKSAHDLFRQDGRSLGERLTHAFGVAFGRGVKQVVIIGSDSPNLPKAYLEQAFDALNEADVVLGPATDGGYYLVGLSRPCLRLFEDVTWSSDQVFELASRNAVKSGYTLRILPTHYDIDTIDDLRTLHNELATRAEGAPSTTKFLSQLTKSKPLFAVA